MGITWETPHGHLSTQTVGAQALTATTYCICLKPTFSITDLRILKLFAPHVHSYLFLTIKVMSNFLQGAFHADMKHKLQSHGLTDNLVFM